MKGVDHHAKGPHPTLRAKYVCFSLFEDDGTSSSHFLTMATFRFLISFFLMHLFGLDFHTQEVQKMLGPEILNHAEKSTDF